MWGGWVEMWLSGKWKCSWNSSKFEPDLKANALNYRLMGVSNSIVTTWDSRSRM